MRAEFGRLRRIQGEDSHVHPLADGVVPETGQGCGSWRGEVNVGDEAALPGRQRLNRLHIPRIRCAPGLGVRAPAFLTSRVRGTLDPTGRHAGLVTTRGANPMLFSGSNALNADDTTESFLRRSHRTARHR